MPVFEEFPYTNFHELNLDWLIGELKKIKAGIIDTEGLEQYRVFDQVPFYIDGVSGDDENPGTASKPFRTLDRFMKLAEQYSAIEGHFISAGSYRLTSGSTIAGLDLKLIGDVAGVKVYLHGDDDTDVYHVFNSHLRLQNVEAYVQNGGDINGSIIGVNSVIALEDANFTNGTLQCNGGELQVQTGSVGSCSLHNGNGRFYHCTITNTDPTKDAYEFKNSLVEMQIRNYTTPLDGDGTDNAVINARGCFLAIRGQMDSAATSGHRYYNEIISQYSLILIKDTVETDLDQYTVATSDLTANLKQTIS